MSNSKMDLFVSVAKNIRESDILEYIQLDNPKLLKKCSYLDSFISSIGNTEIEQIRESLARYVEETFVFSIKLYWDYDEYLVSKEYESYKRQILETARNEYLTHLMYLAYSEFMSLDMEYSLDLETYLFDR